HRMRHGIQPIAYPRRGPSRSPRRRRDRSDVGVRRHAHPTDSNTLAKTLRVAAGVEGEGTDMVFDRTARQSGRGAPGHYGGRRARAHRDEEAWSAMLLDGLAAVYERGWQPMDVAHVLDRTLDRRDGPAVAVAVLFQARTARADQRAPLSWVTQLEALAERHPRAGERAAALHAEGLGDGELGLRLAMDGLDVDHAVA